MGLVVWQLGEWPFIGRSGKRDTGHQGRQQQRDGKHTSQANQLLKHPRT
jgi:hypothetical protein